MKLLRYGPVGREKPGLLDSAGTIRDLSGRISDLTPDQLPAAKLATLAAIDPKTLPAVEGKPRYGRAGERHPQVHRDRPELCRPRGRGESAAAAGAGHLHESHHLPEWPER